MILDFVAGPVGQEFLDGDKFIKVIGGPVGGGKSTVALFDLLRRMVNQKPFEGVRRTKYIILRNTAQQLEQTVKPLIDEWLVKRCGGQLGAWQLTKKVFVFDFDLPDGTTVSSELLLQAADTPDDVQRLLSLEASAAWVEEAREVDPEVFRGLRGRVNRYPNVASGGVTYPGVICSTNPPPTGGFWHDLMTKPPGNTQVYLQPPAILDDGSINPGAENLANLGLGYYDNLLEGATEEWINVYLRNQFGAGNMGKPVFRSSFKKSFHVSGTALQAVPQGINPLLIGMDNGLQAAALIGQQDMRGRVNILGECYVSEDETMGVESFLDKLLVPKLRKEYPQFRPENIVFVLDPACWQRSQVNEETIAAAVGKRGYRVVKANTNDPEKRIGAVEGLLVRQIDGKAGLLIDPACTHFINAMEWGYRYKKGTAGTVTTTPEKNHFSHLADAGQYFCLHYNLQINGGGYDARTRARPVVKSKYTYT